MVANLIPNTIPSNSSGFSRQDFSFLTLCSKADIFCKGSGIGKTVAYQRKPKISFSIMDRFELCYRISDFPELVDRPGGVCLSDLRLDPRLRPFRNQQPVPRQLKHRAGSPLQRQGRLGKPPRLSIFQVSGIRYFRRFSQWSLQELGT